MREFRVTLGHRVGDLARLTETLAMHDMNLKSVAGITDANKAILCLVVQDVSTMRAALNEARIQFEEAEVLSELLEDEPGQVAELASKLANARVNINSIYILARDSPLIEMGFTVDDPKKAKKVLAE
ncbi:MAG: hypothetical protein ACE5F1_14115 [Planctomycetota bacterium]